MTRIRYKNISGILEAGPFKTPDDELRAEINKDGLVTIYNKCNGVVYKDETMASSIKSRTIQNAKKFVKKALQTSGVSMTSEVRPRLDKK